MLKKLLSITLMTFILFLPTLTIESQATNLVTSKNIDNNYTQTYTDYIYMPVILNPYIPFKTDTQFVYSGIKEYHGDNIGIYTVGLNTIRTVTKNENNVAFVHTETTYDPNPKNWSNLDYYDYYSTTDLTLKATSMTPDIGVKWDKPIVFPKDTVLQNDTIITLNGQKFNVTGLYDGVTKFGKTYQYWELLNTEQFVIYDKGGTFSRRINPKDIRLLYSNGSSRLLVFSGVRETYYYKHIMLYDTMLYLEDLTSTTSFN